MELEERTPLREIKSRYKKKGREYKIFRGTIFCLHDMHEIHRGCVDPTDTYQCKNCGLIITDDFFDDEYYKKQVSEYVPR